MRQAFTQADSPQSVRGLRLVCRGVKILSKHYVFHGVQVRYQMKLLKDETDFLRAVTDQCVFTELGKIDAVDNNTARGKRIQATKNIDQRGLARAGRAHQGDPLARSN